MRCKRARARAPSASRAPSAAAPRAQFDPPRARPALPPPRRPAAPPPRRRRRRSAAPNMPRKAGGRRRKRRTHKLDTPGSPSIPRSFVFRRGHVPGGVRDLVACLRAALMPHTARRLKERRMNGIRDYVSVATQIGVTHFWILSATATSPYLRVARVPQGPTLTFRIVEYSLSADVRATQRRPVALEDAHFEQPPLLRCAKRECLYSALRAQGAAGGSVQGGAQDGEQATHPKDEQPHRRVRADGRRAGRVQLRLGNGGERRGDGAARAAGAQDGQRNQQQDQIGGGGTASAAAASENSRRSVRRRRAVPPVREQEQGGGRARRRENTRQEGLETKAARGAGGEREAETGEETRQEGAAPQECAGDGGGARARRRQRSGRRGRRQRRRCVRFFYCY
ncbi:Brix domain containing protein [Gracilaria domingensis]|nr:Brix domain containing protein [Gracilaria domingensis]